ncbi:hypothetical protein DY218_19355 [Streptomyces triticagri]|uniref:Uncharacterized protein n=1 Tax=Streptomyces triticagri TaxID=2293568 RepID=A0A372M2D5_9ACTN|nr:DUF6643 family protein [Streptomyces triticagri]RFU85078.1 hypothetical protein DY218_19355 [Streptomyces triticagri]
MTSPRATYGSGYYPAPSFPDTPIYDSLVAERGTPQIAPIRVPSAYETGGQLPALHSSLPALPAAPSPQQPHYGYPGAAQPTALQQAPAPYIPQQAAGPRGYPGAAQQQRPPQPGGYEAMRPAAPAPMQYEDPHRRPYQGGRGY